MAMVLVQRTVVIERNNTENVSDDTLGLESERATEILEQFVDAATNEIQRQFPELTVKF